jgi:hypothetical protein
MDKINSDNFVEMNAYTLEHRILVTGNTKANWEKEYSISLGISTSRRQRAVRRSPASRM